MSRGASPFKRKGQDMQSRELSSIVMIITFASANVANQAPATLVATDSVTNYANKQPYVGLNLGFGFGPWTAVGGTGVNLTEATGFQQSADIGNNTYTISRGITTPLASGYTLSLTLAADEAKKTGNGASLLLLAAGAQAASISLTYDGPDNWLWDDGSGPIDTGVAYVKAAPATVTFTRSTSSLDGYTFTLSQAGQTTYQTTGIITGAASSSAIDSLRFVTTSGTHSNTSLTYDTLQVQSVPEPSTAVMLSLAALALLLKTVRPQFFSSRALSHQGLCIYPSSSTEPWE